MKKENMKDSLEILSLQESERRRIAEDLHDTTVQELVSLSQQLELANLYLDKDIVQAKLEIVSARKHIKEIINGIRETIYDLRPMAFDDIGWEASIQRLYQDVKDKTDIDVIFNIDNLNIERVTEITIYRIIREAVSNVCRHANASILRVDLHKKQNEIILKICDNGVGIGDKIKENHFGMQLMQEKVRLLAGKMKIETGDTGTSIIIMIPYEI